MRDFCAFILTHGRPDRVRTYQTLRKHGYTGQIFVVIDDEDETGPEYLERYGDEVLTFCKQEAADKTELADNFNNRKAIIYARNACFDLAKQVGVKYFIQLDDDYTDFRFKRDGNFGFIDRREIRDLDRVFRMLLMFYIKTPAITVAIAQGGDFIGGGASGNANTGLLRKCMNSFLCSTARPFKFSGTLNEDVNAYCYLGGTGKLFFTVTSLALQQTGTQQHGGGMTGAYLTFGTYTKSFYTVMFCPSSVKVAVMNSKYPRIHHQINWACTVPMIINERHKK